MSTTTEKKEEIKMEYVNLGKTGLKVSRICMGCASFGTKDWVGTFVFDKEESFRVIERAWKAGINFYDTANAYSNGASEEILGAAIKELGIPRDEIIIATKVFMEMKKKEPLNEGKKAIKNSIKVNNKGLSRKHIFEAVEASLKRLGTDYIDLYQIHRWDDDTPIEETMKALHDLVVSGKVRYLGASTMHAWQFALAQETARRNGWTPFSTMQNLYNLIYREEERDMNPYCYATGVGLIPWAPLAGGYLARNTDPKNEETKTDREKSVFGAMYASMVDDSAKAVRDVVHQIAKEKKVSASQVAVAWLLHQAPVSAPIIGVSKMSHLDDALGSVSVKLTDAELDALEKPYRPKEVPRWFFAKPPLPLRRSKPE